MNASSDRPAPTAPGDSVLESPERENLLIVDDAPDNIRFLSSMLADCGYAIRKALDGPMAIASVETRVPDLILLDVRMPGMDGYEVCRHLKADPTTRDVPIVFLSASDETADKVEAFRAGGADYITKPFQVEEAIARVESQLTIRRLTHRLEERVAQRTADLQATLEALQAAQLQVVKADKMATLGQLVSGVAHEINNPLAFLEGNLEPARDYAEGLLELVVLYREALPDPPPAIAAKIQDLDLDYLTEDLPKLLQSMQLGADRIRQISTSLRVFSRLDADCKVAFDLHAGLDSTLTILQHRLKATERRPAIQVDRQYDRSLPSPFGYPGQLNQVFANLIANAIDAIDEASEAQSFEELLAAPHRLEIATGRSPDGRAAIVRIADDGCGMDPEVKQRAFEYLFTTKPAGRGTGLGLAICRDIVEDKHGGRLSFESEPGKGTAFEVTLPLSDSSTDGERSAA